MANTDFDTKYASNINGLAKANNADIATAKAMLVANLTSGGKYKGGGTLDYGVATKDYNSSLTPVATSTKSTKSSSGSSSKGTSASTTSNASAMSTPASLDFDTQDTYNAQVNAKNALLQQNYNSQINTLKNNYQNSLDTSEVQKANINSNFDDSVKGINKQTYDDVQRSKVLSAQRGVMNSEQGLASDQNKIRAGNDNVNTVTKQKNQDLNALQTTINNLTRSYGNDMLTAETNFGLGKTQTMNEALASKLQADLEVSKYNATAKNQFGMQANEFIHAETMQEDMQAFNQLMQKDDQTFKKLMQDDTFKQEVKMFGLSSALQLKMQSVSEAGANSRAAMSARASASGQSLAREQWEYAKSQDAKDKKDAKQDAKDKAKASLITSGKTYNGDPNVGLYDAFVPWTTKNEKTLQSKKDLMKLDENLTQAEINKYAQDEYMSWWYKMYNGIK